MREPFVVLVSSLLVILMVGQDDSENSLSSWGERLSERLTTGDSGISCSCGRGLKPVIQSITNTRATLCALAGIGEGRCTVAA